MGGNPAFGPYLSGPPIPPNSNEAGWKDVVKVFPGYVTRFVIRWAPQTVKIDGVEAEENLYSFDPTSGHGYMVHCHILDQEDTEMMRPYIPVPQVLHVLRKAARILRGIASELDEEADLEWPERRRPDAPQTSLIGFYAAFWNACR